MSGVSGRGAMAWALALSVVVAGCGDDAAAPPALPAPGAFDLLTPADTTSDVSLTPTLSWDGSTDVVTYWLRLGTSDTFDTGDLVVNDATLTGTTFPVPTPLDAGTTYYWMVQALNDSGMEEAGNNGIAFTTLGYNHTITIDGTNDFITSDEQLTTTTTGYLAYVSWDNDYLYIGMDGTDIGVADGFSSVLVYLDDGASTTHSTGRAYNTQEPALPFAASYHIRVNTSGPTPTAYTTDGSSWSDASWDFTDDVELSGTFMELRVPLADIGSPDTLKLHVCMLNTSSVWTYAGVPDGSFTDGSDPDFTEYYDFNLLSSAAPNSYAASP